MFGVVYLRMKLHSIKASCPILHAGYRAVTRMGCDNKSFRRAADVVGVTHPAGVDIISRCKYPALVIYRDLCSSILTCRSGIYASAKAISHELGSIAYAQDRNAKRKNAVIYRRSTFSISALRASCENNSVRTKLPYICCIDFVKIMYLRVNSTLSDTAGDQLIVLPSEVYYKDPAF